MGKWHLFTFFNGTALYFRPPSDSICACHRILFVLVEVNDLHIRVFFSVMFQKYYTIVVVGWLVDCFGFSGPLRQYFSLYRAVSQREEEERKDSGD